VAHRTVHAVSVVCGTAGLCRLVERPEVLAQKGLRLHNSLAILKPRRELILHLTNISERPVNDQPADVGTDPLCKAGPTEDHPPEEAPSVPVEAQAPKTKRPPQNRVPPDQEPSEPSPSPRVAYELIPPDLHPAVHQLMDRYQGL